MEQRDFAQMVLAESAKLLDAERGLFPVKETKAPGNVFFRALLCWEQTTV